MENLKRILVKALIGERILHLEGELKKLRFDYETRQKYFDTPELLKLTETKIDDLQQEYDLLNSKIQITI